VDLASWADVLNRFDELFSQIIQADSQLRLGLPVGRGEAERNLIPCTKAFPQGLIFHILRFTEMFISNCHNVHMYNSVDVCNMYAALISLHHQHVLWFLQAADNDVVLLSLRILLILARKAAAPLSLHDRKDLRQKLLALATGLGTREEGLGFLAVATLSADEVSTICGSVNDCSSCRKRVLAYILNTIRALHQQISREL